MMRLLHFDASGKLDWTPFSNDVPPYAILSHTWEADQEVTFEDLLSETAHMKPGYKKILFCGEQAARDDLQYFWVDTCAIDKWDLDEVSDAINSMFSWYRNATKCYVYLSDVPSTSFGDSRWWTRGWTLQELIAPASVEFFDSQLQRLGDKQDLEQQIHRITSIPLEALRGHTLDKFTIEERIAWASERETKEEEDGIYCLLGICSVNMPAYYGEGRETAMWRLKKEISDPTNSTNELGADRDLFMVPFERNDQFIGRQSQLLALEEQLFAGPLTTKTAITGISGIGKTSLALELAYRTSQNHAHCSVFWVSATDTESLDQAYRHIAQRLQLPSWDDKNEDVKQIVGLYLSEASAGQWLLIFDNVEIDLWAAEYLPNSQHGSIVFTTTSRENAGRLAPSNVVEVLELDEHIAHLMLRTLLAKSSPMNEQQYASLLLKELGYFPLAIGLAAANINVEGRTVRDYFSLLSEQRDAVGPVLSEGLEYEHPGVKSNIVAVCLISFTDMTRRNKLAADYLLFMACLYTKDIPQALLPEFESYEIKLKAIAALTEYSLVVRRPAGRSLDLHRLVRLSMQNWLRMRNRLDFWANETATHLLRAFPDPDYQYLSKERRLQPHAKYITESGFLEKESRVMVVLTMKYASSLVLHGQYNESETLFSEALETVKRKLGADDPYTLVCMNNLAGIYRAQGRLDAAEQLFVQVVETRKITLGADHIHTLISMGNLAATYWQQERFDAAEELQTQVLEIRKNKRGADHLDTLETMHDLAATYGQQGRLDAAEELQTQVLEIRKNKLGADHPSTLNSAANLASILKWQGRLGAAEKLQVQIMKTCKNKLGANHPDTVNSIASLSYTLKLQERDAEAISLLKDSIQRRRGVLGEDHPDLKDSTTDLSHWEASLSQWEAALSR